MPRQFTQLSLEERETIQQLRWEKQSLRTIAKTLGRNVSTISRELATHQKAYQYHPRLAQERTQEMRRQRGQRSRLKNPQIRAYVEEKLRDEQWSPEQIAGRLSLDHPGFATNHESIYLYIYSRCERAGHGLKVQGEDLRPYLRRAYKRRRRKHPPFADMRGRIQGRVGIEERPKYIEKRKQLGHWEGDSVVSRQSLVALNTLVERATGLVKIRKLKNLTAAETHAAVVAQLTPLPASARRTLTTDNGHENGDHITTAKGVNLRWYFCHAYASHERGTNENTNGLIRQYFPKGTDFATVSDEVVAVVEERLNNRPRKRLKYKTPNEVFNQRVALKR